MTKAKYCSFRRPCDDFNPKTCTREYQPRCEYTQASIPPSIEPIKKKAAELRAPGAVILHTDSCRGATETLEIGATCGRTILFVLG